MVTILGIIGSLIATAGIWDHLIKWLNLLGIVVPGIGGVMIAHFWRNGLDATANPYAALSAWGSAIVLGTIFQFWSPQYSVAVITMLSRAIIFVIIETLNSNKSKKSS